MADPYAITNPKRALKRREEEAEADTASDGGGDTAAPAKKADEAPAEGGVRWSKGPQKMTPEEEARRRAQFRALQRKQRTQVL